MLNKSLFTATDEEKFIANIKDCDWTQATNIVYDKMKAICLSVFYNSGKVFEGRFIEPEDFLHDQWLNIFQYLSSENKYMEAESPLGYVINHIQKYTLRLNSNDTKQVHLFQDTRYAGSQRVPYKRSIRGKEYREHSITSLEGIKEYSEQFNETLENNESLFTDYEQNKWSEKDTEDIVMSQTNNYILTKELVINMMYMQIGDIRDTIDISELTLPKEPAMFLTNEERG